MTKDMKEQMREFEEDCLTGKFEHHTDKTKTVNIQQLVIDEVLSKQNHKPNKIDETLYNSISPNHYTSFMIPPNDYITANSLEWEVGNVIKYVSRYHLKNGKEDLLKAIKYIELLIERKYIS
jgi:Protein of unknwon function (DUF3310)